MKTAFLRPSAWIIGCLLSLLLAGCATNSAPREKPWNEKTRHEISKGWYFKGNEDQSRESNDVFGSYP